jgi:hypothetical protein
MIIALTNATPAFRGKIILLNTDLFVSVHRATVTREDGLIEDITYVHCPPHGTWEVQEEVEDVVALIEKKPTASQRQKRKNKSLLL